MVQMGTEEQKLEEMLLMACPRADKILPIAQVGAKDQLKAILDPIGFEFLTPTAKDADAIRLELDPDSTGTCTVDKMVAYLAKVVRDNMSEDHLTEAFELFDADHDGKINMEEFEFFMNGFARDMNKLRDSKMVK